MTNTHKVHNSRFIIQDSVVLLLYGIIAVVMNWPLAANLSGQILRGRVDEYMFMWGFWWMRYSLGTLHTWPFHTDMLYYPFGTELAFHTWSPLVSTLSIPVQDVWGVEVAFNLAILAAYIFSAFSMYLLVSYLVRDRRAAFVGGLVFAFSTFKFYQTTGHIHVISTQFLPIYLLFFIRMLRETDHRRRHAAFAGLSLGFIFLIDYYQTVYAMFFSLCYLIYYLWGREPQAEAGDNPPQHSALSTQHSALSTLGIVVGQPLAGVRRRGLLIGRRLFDRRLLLTTGGLLLILGAVFAVIGSPLLIADYIAIRDGYYVKWPGEDTYFADAIAFFVPANPLLSGWQPGGLNWWDSMGSWATHPAQASGWVQQAISSFYNGTESWVFAGYLTLILVAIGTVRLWKRQPEYRFWVAFVVICYLFALGPTPHFAGNTIPLPGDHSFWNALPFVKQDAAGDPQLPGPYALWAAIPLLNNARIPARFDMLITLGAGIMVGYALADLFALIPRRWPHLRPALLTTVLLFVISFVTLFEHFVIPFLAEGGHQLDEPRATYAAIAAEPNNYAVLNIPEYSAVRADFGYEHTMYDQTMHHKPVLFAGISRPLLDFKPYYIRERYINILTQTAPDLQPMEKNLQTALADPLMMDFYRQEGARLLYYLDIGYLVVHPPALAPSAMQFIVATLPLQQLYPDGPPVGDTVVYRVQRERLPAIQLDTVQMGDESSAVFRMMGFDRIERDPAGNPLGYTWMTDTHALLLTPVREPADYSVSLNLRPLVPAGGSQTFSLYLNDESSPAATITMSSAEWQTQSVSINREHWRVGLNKMTIRASYIADPTSAQPRPLVAAFKTIAFNRRLAADGCVTSYWVS
jgi:Dolichyl-phosphate-mannose-protein mannosyltransferase